MGRSFHTRPQLGLKGGIKNDKSKEEGWE
jgi:hypothetical protein